MDGRLDYILTYQSVNATRDIKDINKTQFNCSLHIWWANLISSWRSVIRACSVASLSNSSSFSLWDWELASFQCLSRSESCGDEKYENSYQNKTLRKTGNTLLSTYKDELRQSNTQWTTTISQSDLR